MIYTESFNKDVQGVLTAFNHTTKTFGLIKYHLCVCLVIFICFIFACRLTCFEYMSSIHKMLAQRIIKLNIPLHAMKALRGEQV
jgi:hypothetical protein